MANPRKEIVKDGEKTRFTSERQPANPGRKPATRAWKDVLADMMPDEGYLTFEKAQVLGADGKPTGEVIPKVRVKMATQEMIVLAAIKQAMKGDMRAIVPIWERMDGKPAQPLEGTDKPIIFQVAQPTGTDTGNDLIE